MQPNLLQETHDEIFEFFRERELTLSRDDVPFLQTILTRARLRGILTQLIRPESAETLAAVARASYVHSLGFRKISLLYEPQQAKFDQQGWELRHHLWRPKWMMAENISLVEGRHKHNWDMVSTIDQGGFENHSYRGRPLEVGEEALFGQLQKRLQEMDPAKLKNTLDRLDLLEGTPLLGQSQRWESIHGDSEVVQASIDLPELQNRLGLSEDELRQVALFFTKMANKRDLGSILETYSEVGNFHVGLQGVQALEAGTTYFHSSDSIHRLLLDPRRVTSTLALIGPGKGSSSGELVRTTLGRPADRPRTYFTPETLRSEFETYLSEAA
jgi:hypothetical protein